MANGLKELSDADRQRADFPELFAPLGSCCGGTRCMKCQVTCGYSGIAPGLMICPKCGEVAGMIGDCTALLAEYEKSRKVEGSSPAGNVVP